MSDTKVSDANVPDQKTPDLKIQIPNFKQMIRNGEMVPFMKLSFAIKEKQKREQRYAECEKCGSPYVDDVKEQGEIESPCCLGAKLVRGKTIQQLRIVEEQTIGS